jgi:hypothetical protein
MSVACATVLVDKEMRNEMNKEQDFQVNANGFTVLNAEDGYRKDNRLWFGECSECGERITNSALKGIWEHEIVIEEKRYENGAIAYRSSRKVDYCPMSVA